jgi:hypothetical protein
MRRTVFHLALRQAEALPAACFACWVSISAFLTTPHSADVVVLPNRCFELSKCIRRSQAPAAFQIGSRNLIAEAKKRRYVATA